MRPNTRRLVVAACAVALVAASVLPVWAQADDDAKARERAAYLEQIGPPVMPPLPPAPNRQALIEQAFGLFPGIDRGAAMALAESHFTRDMRHFSKLAFNDEPQAVQVLTRVINQARELLEIKRADPDQYERLMKARQLENIASHLADTARRAEGAQQEAVVARLNTILDEAFEVRQQIMQHDVAQMESELTRLKELLRKRDANRVAIVGRRLTQLTGREDHLDW